MPRSVTARWRIQLCGELRVEFAGEPREAALRGRQGRLLLAYLVLHRARPVRRDELVEALWSHDGAPPSDTALAPVLSRLRRAVEPAAIDGRDRLQLVFEEPVWIDVEAVAELVATARTADPAGAVAAASEAAALAAPGLLPGFDAPWLTGPRTELEELRAEGWSWPRKPGCASAATRCRRPSAPPARPSPRPRTASRRARR